MAEISVSQKQKLVVTRMNDGLSWSTVLVNRLNQKRREYNLCLGSQEVMSNEKTKYKKLKKEQEVEVAFDRGSNNQGKKIGFSSMKKKMLGQKRTIRKIAKKRVVEKWKKSEESQEH